MSTLKGILAGMSLVALSTGCGAESGDVLQPELGVGAAEQASTFAHGSFDAIINGSRAIGWACAPSYASTYYTVRITHTTDPRYYQLHPSSWTFVSQGIANTLRESAVGSACGGNPYHGFDIPFGSRSGYFRMEATAPGLGTVVAIRSWFPSSGGGGIGLP